MASESQLDISAAIVLYLNHYPGSNFEEFQKAYPNLEDYDAVRTILDETCRTPIDGLRTIRELYADARERMHQLHPELTESALHSLGNYFAYLMK